MQEIKTYYDNLAGEYDSNRFDNTYGSFIHTQELRVLHKHKGKLEKSKCFDLGCGTGRFMEFASFGVDISEQMLEVASKKYPHKNFFLSSAEKLPFENNSFQSAISFHLFMHLEKKVIEKVLNEVHRVLAPRAYFLFDIPSKARRDILRQQRSGWHGSTSLDKKLVQKMTAGKWEIIAREGICFFPIHRIPHKLRKKLSWVDLLICNGYLGKYSSYHIYVLRKL